MRRDEASSVAMVTTALPPDAAVRRTRLSTRTCVERSIQGIRVVPRFLTAIAATRCATAAQRQHRLLKTTMSSAVTLNTRC